MVNFLLKMLSYPSLVCPVYESSEVLHPPVSVWILEEDATHILPTEVHVMGQLQHSFHPNVAAKQLKLLETKHKH